jgi:hypothetical protein
MFICLIDVFVLVIIEICQKIFSKIEIVDRCNLYCTGKLLQNFEMQKWEKQKAKISQTHQILKEKKSKSPDCAVGSKEYRRIEYIMFFSYFHM